MSLLSAGLFLATFHAQPASAQLTTNGTVLFANRVPGAMLVTRVFAPCPTNPTLSFVGNGNTVDLPPGVMDWSAFTAIGTNGLTGQYSAAGTFAQLLSANGANQPESLLMPQSQTTTFRTGRAAGFVALVTAMLSNVPEDAPAATVQMVAWDNSSSNYPTWTEALPAWKSGLIAAGKSVVLSLTNIGGPVNVPPFLLGLQSFNLFFAASPSFVSQPPSQTAEQGSTVTWSLQATGSTPLSYQWFLNDSAVSVNPADNHLTLSNVQYAQAGLCTVVVTNLFGTVTSAPAILNVITPVERRPVPGIKVIGQLGTSWDVVCADYLSPAPNWTCLGSISLNTAPQYYFDLTQPLPPQRFYRTQLDTDPFVVPILDLHMIPAITLTGSIGASVRVDYINRFGSTDAWVTLDTVTLTNTSQLYFDIFAPGQPERLYRLVPVP
jgi:hypothetical protein